MQVFAWRNIHEKLPKAVSFTSIYITFNIIVGIGVAKVSALDVRNFRQSIQFPMVADANGGFFTATGMTKCTPLCILTHSLKHFQILIFEFREVQTFKNRPFVFSPHPATPLSKMLLYIDSSPWGHQNCFWKLKQVKREHYWRECKRPRSGKSKVRTVIGWRNGKGMYETHKWKGLLDDKIR